MVLELAGGEFGQLRRLGEEPEIHQRVGMLQVVLAERQPGRLVQPCRLTEQAQALGQPARLNRYPAAALGNQGHHRRADPGGQFGRLRQTVERGAVVPVLGLDERHVVGHDGPHGGWGVWAHQRAPVDGGGFGQPADVLQQGGLLQVQFGRTTIRQEGGRAVEVALGGRQPPQLVVDRRPGDQRLAEALDQPAAVGDADRLVEQRLGPAVRQPGPL